MKHLLYALFLVLTSCGGSQGAPGPVGVIGATGSPGSVTTVQSQYCTGLGSLNNTTLNLSYHVETYSNGDSLVTCSLSDGEHTYSNNNLNDTSCDIDYSTMNNGNYFTFTTVSAVYTDNSGGHNGYTIDFTCETME